MMSTASSKSATTAIRMDSIWGDDPEVATDNDWSAMETVFTNVNLVMTFRLPRN